MGRGDRGSCPGGCSLFNGLVDCVEPSFRNAGWDERGGASCGSGRASWWRGLDRERGGSPLEGTGGGTGEPLRSE